MRLLRAVPAVGFTLTFADIAPLPCRHVALARCLVRISVVCRLMLIKKLDLEIWIYRLLRTTIAQVRQRLQKKVAYFVV